MTVLTEIATARTLLEEAEREVDHELKAHKLEEALIVLETCADDGTEDERILIGNLRASYTRRLLAQLPSLRTVTGDEWFALLAVLVKLDKEIREVAASDARLKENYVSFSRLWAAEALDALRKAR